MSRQNLVEIEAGRRLPGLAATRSLTLALRWSMDELAGYLPYSDLETGVHWAFDSEPTEPTAVVWTLIEGRTVAAQSGRLSVEFAQDGTWDPREAVIRENVGTRDPQSTLFIAGCDPLLLWLWDRTEHPDMTLYMFSMGSEPAVRALDNGDVHIAGTHLFDPETGRYNENVERLTFGVRRLQYLYWESGALGALDNPRGWALREAGSEARALYQRHFAGRKVHPGVELDSHWAVARYVRSHPQMAGVSIRPVAHTMNLPFVKWSEEPFEWVTRADWTRDPRIRAFEIWLGSPVVAQLLGAVPGVVPWDPGRIRI